MDYPIGFIALMPEAEVCYCGDGTPHHHPYQVAWNGSRWVRQGTKEWDDLQHTMLSPGQKT